MDYKKIEDLLDDYWNGVTTLEQEKELVNFFTKEEVPAHLKEYAPLFQFFDNEKEIEVSTSFESNLMAALKKEQVKEQKETQSEIQPETKVRSLWRPLLKIAAAVAILLSPFFIYPDFTLETKEEFAMADTFETPEEAYAETMRALQLIASKLDKIKS